MDVVDVELQRLVQLSNLLGVPLEFNWICVVEVLSKMLQELLSCCLRILRRGDSREYNEVFVHESLMRHLLSIDAEQ